MRSVAHEMKGLPAKTFAPNSGLSANKPAVSSTLEPAMMSSPSPGRDPSFHTPITSQVSNNGPPSRIRGREDRHGDLRLRKAPKLSGSSEKPSSLTMPASKFPNKKPTRQPSTGSIRQELFKGTPPVYSREVPGHPSDGSWTTLDIKRKTQSKDPGLNKSRVTGPFTLPFILSSSNAGHPQTTVPRRTMLTLYQPPPPLSAQSPKLDRKHQGRDVGQIFQPGSSGQYAEDVSHKGASMVSHHDCSPSSPRSSDPFLNDSGSSGGSEDNLWVSEGPNDVERSAFGFIIGIQAFLESKF
ncbi:hypothetical protein FRC18_007295 [Serendipita sp. 400]|nr:hypothetical protein FRC18_007295 [Serendipita sp. 400]